MGRRAALSIRDRIRHVAPMIRGVGDDRPRTVELPAVGEDHRSSDERVSCGQAGAADPHRRRETRPVAVEPPHARCRCPRDHAEVGRERGDGPGFLGSVAVVDGHPSRRDPPPGGVVQGRCPVAGGVAGERTRGRLAEHRRVRRGRARAAVAEELVHVRRTRLTREHDRIVHRAVRRPAFGLDRRRLHRRRAEREEPHRGEDKDGRAHRCLPPARLERPAEGHACHQVVWVGLSSRARWRNVAPPGGRAGTGGHASTMHPHAQVAWSQGESVLPPSAQRLPGRDI